MQVAPFPRFARRGGLGKDNKEKEQNKNGIRLGLEPNDTLAGSLISAQAHLPLFRYAERGSWQKVRRGENGKKKTEAIASVFFLCYPNNFEPYFIIHCTIEHKKEPQKSPRLFFDCKNHFTLLSLLE